MSIRANPFVKRGIAESNKRSSFLTIVITRNRQPMAVLRPKRKRRVAPPNAESERE